MITCFTPFFNRKIKNRSRHAEPRRVIPRRCVRHKCRAIIGSAFEKGMERPRAEGKTAGEIREKEHGNDDLAIFREQREVVRENHRLAVHLRLPCGLGAAPRKRASRKRVQKLAAQAMEAAMCAA